MADVDLDKCASASCGNTALADSGVYCWDCIKVLRRKLRAGLTHVTV